MKPSIGRIVHYTWPRLSRNRDFNGPQGQADTVPAIIVAVLSDTVVNLRVFQDGAAAVASVTSVQEKSEHPGVEHGDYWEWPERV